MNRVINTSGWFLSLTAFFLSTSSAHGDATTDIIRQMTYGTRPSSGPPVVAPGIPTTPGIPNNGHCVPIVTVPSWGWGWGGNDWGYNYQQGYYDGSLETENYFLRQQLERDRWERRMQEEADEQQRAAARADEEKQGQRDRVERTRAANAIKAGIRLFKKGSRAQATQRFRQAAELDPNDSAAVFCLAQALFSGGDYRAAASAIREGLARTPDWPKANLDLRTLYDDQGDLVIQMGQLARHLKENPLDADALYVLGFELFATGEGEKSRTIFEQVAKLSPAAEHTRPFLDALISQTPPNAPPPPPAGRKRIEESGAIPVPRLLENHLELVRGEQ